jgi:hypothetical protein
MRRKVSLVVVLAAIFAFSAGAAQGAAPTHRGHPPMRPSSKPKPKSTSPAASKPADKPHR